MRRLELLAPAKDYDVAIAAINHGADAVYIGAEGFGARSAACNSITDIARVVDYAHQFGVRVYVTFNTLIYDEELSRAEAMICQLYRIGVDALIIQDLGILRMDIPPIELHASTQCDIRSAEKAVFLQSLGFSQMVLARELNKAEIEDIRSKTTVRLEAFVHGALCVSYSGRCQVSQVLKGRSANRGECAQICRLPFDLVDENGNVLARNKHLLSLRDLNLSNRIGDMVAAGIDSFKIEGRLKDAGYVKNVVAYYRRVIDNVIAANPGDYKRASYGTVVTTFDPDVRKSFNRGFTHYFFDTRDLRNGERIASVDTPKSVGEKAGTVKKCTGKVVEVSSSLQFNNGDGISFFDRRGTYTGFRINRVEGKRLYLSQNMVIPAGTELYRTYNKRFDDELNSSGGERKIKVDFKLRVTADGRLVLEAHDERGNKVSCAMQAEINHADNPQDARQADTLAKLGNTIYSCGNVVTVGDMFVPQSLLAQLRRQVVDALDKAQRVNYRYGYRLNEDMLAKCFSTSLLSADNVANRLARKLYADHGVEDIVPAVEAAKQESCGMTVMHTRYCLRRELGLCLKTEAGRAASQQLFLEHGDVVLPLQFDCKACEMRVMSPSR